MSVVGVPDQSKPENLDDSSLFHTDANGVVTRVKPESKPEPKKEEKHAPSKRERK